MLLRVQKITSFCSLSLEKSSACLNTLLQISGSQTSRNSREEVLSQIYLQGIKRRKADVIVPATVEESVHIQVHEDGEDLLLGEAVEARLVSALEAAEVVGLQQILNRFVPFVWLLDRFLLAFE